MRLSSAPTQRGLFAICRLSHSVRGTDAVSSPLGVLFLTRTAPGVRRSLSRCDAAPSMPALDLGRGHAWLRQPGLRNDDTRGWNGRLRDLALHADTRPGVARQSTSMPSGCKASGQNRKDAHQFVPTSNACLRSEACSRSIPPMGPPSEPLQASRGSRRTRPAAGGSSGYRTDAATARPPVGDGRSRTDAALRAPAAQHRGTSAWRT